MHPIPESHYFQRCGRMLVPFLPAQADQLEGQLDILECREYGYKIEALENEADVNVAPYAKAILAEGCQIGSQDLDVSGRRTVNASHDVQ